MRVCVRGWFGCGYALQLMLERNGPIHMHDAGFGAIDGVISLYSNFSLPDP